MAVGVAVWVGVGVGVDVGVSVGVAVAVSVRVGVELGVSVGVELGVGVGVLMATVDSVTSPIVAVEGSSVTVLSKLPPDTVPWLPTCVTPAGNGSLMTTWKVTVALPPLAARLPMSTVTGGDPALPPVTVPTVVETEPSTNVVLASGVSLNMTAVAAVLPWFWIVTVYSKVSPGLVTPLPSASTARATSLLAVIRGAAVTCVTVASFGAEVLGSSVDPEGNPKINPWA